MAVDFRSKGQGSIKVEEERVPAGTVATAAAPWPEGIEASWSSVISRFKARF